MKINNLNDFITSPDMSGYESPIKMYIGQMVEQVEKAREGEIIRTIREDYAIDVNKDELIKALNYDRGQYEKGYADRGKMIVPVTLEMEQSGVVRQIKGYLDKATQIIYANSITVECVEAIGWKIKESDN